MAFLLDADWVINALAGHQQATATLRRLRPQAIAISLVTVAEVYEGAHRSSNPMPLIELYRRLLFPFRKLGLTEAICERFAELRAGLRRRGELISDFDLMLAATALELDYTVLTFNLRHLRRVPDLKLYQLA